MNALNHLFAYGTLMWPEVLEHFRRLEPGRHRPAGTHGILLPIIPAGMTAQPIEP
jgi:hypothetical protein